MKQRPFSILKISLILILLLFITGFFTWWLVGRATSERIENYKSPYLDEIVERPGLKNYYELITPYQTFTFNLVAPDAAPEAIREKVKYGFKVMTQTAVHAKEYVGNQLCCVNCHFNGGNTFGGKNGSISLVGVSSWYPTYSERDGKEITLADRINNCFQRSLNGKALPDDSKEMEGLLAYFDWISKDVAHLKDTPWRGLITLKSKHKPDPVKGKEVWEAKCAPCHGAEGQGVFKEDDQLIIPPVWGAESFNDGAGMNRIQKIAPFVYCNMPFGEPTLTEEEALDVAGFVTQQDRPTFHD